MNLTVAEILRRNSNTLGESSWHTRHWQETRRTCATNSSTRIIFITSKQLPPQLLIQHHVRLRKISRWRWFTNKTSSYTEEVIGGLLRPQSLTKIFPRKFPPGPKQQLSWEHGHKFEKRAFFVCSSNIWNQIPPHILFWLIAMIFKHIYFLINFRQCNALSVFSNIGRALQQLLPRDASAERGDEIACRLSVRPSVRNVQVPCTNRLEFFENNFTAE